MVDRALAALTYVVEAVHLIIICHPSYSIYNLRYLAAGKGMVLLGRRKERKRMKPLLLSCGILVSCQVSCCDITLLGAIRAGLVLMFLLLGATRRSRSNPPRHLESKHPVCLSVYLSAWEPKKVPR